MSTSLFAINPYWGKDFFGFLLLFFQRIGCFIRGELGWDCLASDEVQILVLCFVSFSSALLGAFLVLKKMTMLANSLSHTILLGIVLAYIVVLPSFYREQIGSHALSLKVLIIAALFTGLITALGTQFLVRVFKLPEDASIGLVFTTLFALGIVLVTVFTRSSHIGTEVIMGNADALHRDDVKIAFTVACVDLCVIFFLFKEFALTTFDPSLSRTLGISPTFLDTLLMMLVSGTIISAFRAVGVLLVLAFLVGPVLIARPFSRSLVKLIVFSSLIGVLCSFLAVGIGRHLLSVYQMPLSTAGLVVALMGAVYGLSTLIFVLKKRKNLASVAP